LSKGVLTVPVAGTLWSPAHIRTIQGQVESRALKRDSALHIFKERACRLAFFVILRRSRRDLPDDGSVDLVPR
jgi:hypothetical protein